MVQLLSLSHIFISFKEVVYNPLIIKFLLNELAKEIRDIFARYNKYEI